MTFDTQTFAPSPPSSGQVLLGVPRPQALPFSPALATPAQAESVYAEILQRFAAYARAAAIPLATPSILAAALWSDDRLRWLAARLQSGAATPEEAELVAQIVAAANEIFEIFQRWLVIDGGDPTALGFLWETLNGQPAQPAIAANALALPATNSALPGGNAIYQPPPQEPAGAIVQGADWLADGLLTTQTGGEDETGLLGLLGVAFALWWLFDGLTDIKQSTSKRKSS